MNERTDMPIHNLRCTEPDRFAKPPGHEAPDAAILAYLQHSETCAYHDRLNQQVDSEMDLLLHAASRNLVVARPSMKRRRQDRRPAARVGNILRRMAALGLAASLTVLLWFGYTSLIDGGMQAPQEVAEAAPAPVANPVSPMVQVGENGQLYAARVISNTLEGQRTKSGMIYHPDSLSASVSGLPFGSRLRVTNPVTGASVVVTVIDRGPMDDEINLSASAADSLGIDGKVMLLVDIVYTPPPMAIGP